MLIYENTEVLGLHGQRKFGNPSTRYFNILSK